MLVVLDCKPMLYISEALEAITQFEVAIGPAAQVHCSFAMYSHIKKWTNCTVVPDMYFRDQDLLICDQAYLDNFNKCYEVNYEWSLEPHTRYSWYTLCIPWIYGY